MKTTSIIGICLLVSGLLLAVLHFTMGKFSLAAAGGLSIAGVVLLITSRCGT